MNNYEYKQQKEANLKKIADEKARKKMQDTLALNAKNEVENRTTRKDAKEHIAKMQKIRQRAASKINDARDATVEQVAQSMVQPQITAPQPLDAQISTRKESARALDGPLDLATLVARIDAINNKENKLKQKERQIRRNDSVKKIDTILNPPRTQTEMQRIAEYLTTTDASKIESDMTALSYAISELEGCSAEQILENPNLLRIATNYLLKTNRI